MAPKKKVAFWLREKKCSIQSFQQNNMGPGTVHLPYPYGCSPQSYWNKITEWIIILIGIIILFVYQSSSIQPHKQCIPGQDADCGNKATSPDPGLAYPIKSSTVDFTTINIICPMIWFFLFLINVFIINCYYKIFDKNSQAYKIILIKFEILLRSITVSIVFTSVTTEIIKTSVGRPRPNYLNDNDPSDAVKSFPSGHTSYIFSIFFILTLYLFHSLLNARRIVYFYKNMSKVQQNDDQTNLPKNEDKDSKEDDVLSPCLSPHTKDDIESNSATHLSMHNDMDVEDEVKLLTDGNRFNEIDIQNGRILSVFNGDSYFFLSLFIHMRHFHLFCVLLVLSPTFFSMYVGCSRLTDYKHHYIDVSAGALIGIFYSVLSFFYYKSEFYYGFKYDWTKGSFLNPQPK